ncbi:MAG: hypothetical protein WKF87_02030 [Chryseolinea sp.]
MFRLLLILGIITYLIYKVGSFFFKAGAASQQLRDQQRRNFEAPVKNPPQTRSSFNHRNETPSKKDRAGDYIDYEEVK